MVNFSNTLTRVLIWTKIGKKKEVAKRLFDILNEESVKFEKEDLAILVNSGYPDIRRVLNAGQRQVIKGELMIDKTSTIQANYMDEVLTLLKSNGGVKDIFTSVRKVVADSKVKDFEPHSAIFVESDDNMIFYKNIITKSKTLLKKNGLMFTATINRTLTSYLKAIVGAEYILRWLPIGTHDWNKFIKPEELEKSLNSLNFSTKNIRGLEFNPFLKKWKRSNNLTVNYIISSIKD